MTNLPETRPEWERLARSRLKLILRIARSISELKAKAPSPDPWMVDFQLVGSVRMSQFNEKYRGKNYPTDVLSFPAPAFFFNEGRIGDLVICLPILKKQAKALKTSPRVELDVLLVHGVLHLLGFDHEKGPKAAALMAAWEARILGKMRRKAFQQKGRELGLIERANSDKR